MSEYKDLVREAAQKYGFNLEFKTKKILEENQYQVDLNVPLTGGIEVDVKATKDQHKQVLIECKGTDPTSCLILVKEAKSEYYNSRRHIIAHTNFAIAQYKPHPESDFYTFTGDFFNLRNKNNKKKELTRNSSTDSNNNFYKAQSQIIEALNAISKPMASENQFQLQMAISKSDLSSEDKLKALINIDDLNIIKHENLCYLIPVIVTNVKSIWVVDYTQDEVIVEPHQWVLQKARINEQIPLKSKNGEKPYSISISVVSISYLSQFLKFIEAMSVPEGEISIDSSYIKENV